MEKKVFSYFFLFVIIIVGLLSLNLLPKESQPDVQVPIAVINTPYFGASATEVEGQVTDEIEKSIKNISGIKEIKSTSSTGNSSVVVQLNQDENITEKIDEIKDKIDSIKSSLPQNANNYTIYDIKFSDAPMFSFVLFSNENNFSLKKTVDDLSDELEKVNGVSSVSHTGLPELEYSIWLDEKKIEQYSLSFAEIRQKISSSNILIPVGELEIENQPYVLNMKSKIENITQLENIPIKNFKNNVLFLKNIAKIEKNFKEQKINSNIFLWEDRKKQNSVIFNVSKEKGYNILKLTDSLEEKLLKLKESRGIEYKIILNIGEYAWKDIVNLSKNGLMTTLLVFLILIFILKTKDAFIAAIGIPISFLVAFIFFLLVENTINFISLFSMILAIGILVDSDIVITEGIAKRKEKIKAEEKNLSEKEQEEKASRLAIQDLAGPMIAGTATTIAVFVPLLFLSGVTGDFIKNIPFTIIFILLASQVVSILFIPLMHSTRSKRKIKITKKIKKLNFEKFEKKYKKVLGYFFQKRKRENIFVSFVLIFFTITIILPISGIIKSEFFPGGDVDYIYINIELDRNASKDETVEYMKRLDQEVLDKDFYTSIISTSGKTSDFNNKIDFGDRFGNILINFKDEEKSNGLKHLSKLRTELESKGYDKIEVSAPEGGPPTGTPIDFKVLGDNFKEVRNSSLLIEKILTSYPEVLNIDSSLEKNNIGFDIVVDRGKASLMNVDLSSVALKILAKTSGVKVFEIKNGEEKIETFIKISNTEDRGLRQNNLSPEKILNTKIKNNVGEYIFLSSFVKILPKSKNSSLKHYNTKKSISITAKKTEKSNLIEIIEKFKKEFTEKNSYNTKIEFGGAFAEQEQSFGETGLAFMVGIAAIFGILIFLFNSIRLSFIIESVIPLAFSGVIIGLFVTGNSISFPAILGFIALSGIIVNNSIILIYVYENRRKKLLDEKGEATKEEMSEIVKEGSISRLRPIILTTMTTIIGVMPLIATSAIWAPISYTIIFGLLFATVITLIFIPILYKKFYPKK